MDNKTMNEKEKINTETEGTEKEKAVKDEAAKAVGAAKDESQNAESTTSEAAIKDAKARYKADKAAEPKVHISERIKKLDPWKKKWILAWLSSFALIGLLYMGCSGYSLYKDKSGEAWYWEDRQIDRGQETVKQYNENATVVTAGTYIENLREVNVKSSYFRVVFSCWFRWEGDDELDMANNFRIYNGVINKKEVLEEYSEGDVHYQQLRVDATIQQNYWITRFPLESYQLRVYMESNYSVDRVMFEADTEYSAENPYLNITGFDFVRSAVSTQTMEYENNFGSPEQSVPMSHELCTSIEINRAGIGLYVKCFIALFGTITWIFITLFLCTYHRVDPLGMIPAALFGTVTNIMVGANLLPDSLHVGLLEYVNVGGIMIILGGAISVVNINRIRSKYQDADFAFIFGRTMFFTLLFFTAVGAVIYPLLAYQF